MTEPKVGETEDGTFRHYTPQHPLPEEIRKMSRDDTVCQYCGVSYLIHTEIKKLEDRLKATEEELERYRGQEDRESRLREEKEELLNTNRELREQLTSKENLLSKLKQELRLATESTKALEIKFQQASENAEKYKQRHMAALQQFASLSFMLQQPRQTLQELRQTTQSFRDCTNKELREAQAIVRDLNDKIQTDFQAMQSRLQCVEREHTVTSESNKTLNAKMHSQEEKIRNLEHCEQEMFRLQTLNKEMQIKLTEVQGQLTETVARERNLQIEADQFRKQIRTKTEELEQAMKDKHQLAHSSEGALHELDRQLRQKEGELGAVQKQLKTLENKYKEVERRQADITQQRVLSENEAINLKESLEQAKGDVEALKNEREMMITAHHLRIEELRESFKRKMAEHERWPEQLQGALAEEKSKHQSALTALETRLKESFVMELKIEKEKYDELLQKYQVQTKERNSQKIAEITEAESRHGRELEAVQHQLKEAKRCAENREAELRKEMDSLKRIISDLQDKLATFESQGEKQAGQLSRELQSMRVQLKDSEEKAEALSSSLQQAKEEVQFLQDTVRNECEERFELTEALSQVQRELLALKRPNGGYNSGASTMTSPSSGENGLAPIKKSASINNLHSTASSTPSENGTWARQPSALPMATPVNVSYKGNDGPHTKNTPRRNSGPSGTVDDNRKRISALLGRP